MAQLRIPNIVRTKRTLNIDLTKIVTSFGRMEELEMKARKGERKEN